MPGARSSSTRRTASAPPGCASTCCPPRASLVLRDSFRSYVDSRIDAYRRLPDVAGLRAGLARSQTLQSTIWAQALAAAQGSQPATMLLVPALNDMFDITATRSRALLAHPPTIIYLMLFGVALISAAIAGVGMAADRAPDWFRLIAFAGVTAVTFYVILDIEHPRIGLISIDASDQPLIDLRGSMQ